MSEPEKIKRPHYVSKKTSSAVPFGGTEIIPGDENAQVTQPKNEYETSAISRRGFLKAFGFSIGTAAVLAACKRPVINALPYIIQPPEITPGKALYYASTFFDGHEYASVVVKTRDGRPIKIEGNILSAFNGEGTTARVQASVLSLYDDARLKNASGGQTASDWGAIDSQVVSELEKVNAVGKEIVLLTPTIISPSTIKLISEFGSQFGKFSWVRYDSISRNAIREANRLSFGKAVIPDILFRNARLVVGINADFLGTWIAPVHFIPDYVSRRRLNNGEEDMLRHIQYETGLTTTGCSADLRKKLKPSEEKAFVTDLHNRIAEKLGKSLLPAEKFSEDLTYLADEILAAGYKSVVISGTNDIGIQIIVNRINYILGSYRQCLDLNNYLNLCAGDDSEMENLVNRLDSGSVGALLMFNVNPAYDYPDSGKFIDGLKKAELTVNMAVSQNETVGLARFECPVNHYLESWDDAEIIPGQLSLSQPCISPIFNTRSFQDSLLKWSGKAVSWADYLSSNWESSFFHFSKMNEFRKFWEQVLSNGVFMYAGNITGPVLFDENALSYIEGTQMKPAGEGFELILPEGIPLATGLHANNPWLMELPDPVTKHCWENVVVISPGDAAMHGIINGDILRLRENIELPALIQPGQTEGTLMIMLGYGRKNSGKVADNKGVNVFPLVENHDGYRTYSLNTAVPEKTGKSTVLALTQLHHSMEGRPIVRSTVLSRYKEDQGSGNEFHRQFEESHKTLYPDVKFDGFHWGMAIDLNSCIGCNACVIACQAENNVPTVGKSEVTRHRIMHWLKIDRYFEGDQNNPTVLFQPLTCQHCDNAPCENVCPVSATNHSNEGLNQMTYNRCVGTKYCINNCPYKVRRFNWFRYTSNKVFDFNSASDLGKMVLNPDVTVRERGVVEKCSFCVQRIQEKKLQAKLENRTLKDFEIKTACMQACPARAITFGNLKDSGSKVSGLFEDPRCYQLLENLHTLPSTGYLTRVWNDEIIDS